MWPQRGLGTSSNNHAYHPHQYTNWYSETGAGYVTRLPTVTTPTLTPTTLASIEQTFIELQSVPVSSAAVQDLSRQSGFVPPIVDPMPTNLTRSDHYSEYGQDDSDSDPEWDPSPAKKSRMSAATSVIRPNVVYQGSAGVSSQASPSRKTGRRSKKDDKHLTPEEEERRTIRRERNKLAAAKCRQRRVDQTNTLITETENLEEQKAGLENEIQSLQQQKEQLEFLLEAHRPMCNARKNGAVHIKTEDLSDCSGHELVTTSASDQVPQPLLVLTSNQQAAVTSRPTTLSLQSRTSTANSVTEATGVVISTPSNGVFTLGLDSMVDGHTGLTPITGAPSCGSEVQRSCSSDSNSPNDPLASPTTLMAL